MKSLVLSLLVILSTLAYAGNALAASVLTCSSAELNLKATLFQGEGSQLSAFKNDEALIANLQIEEPTQTTTFKNLQCVVIRPF
jgi:hypothetical protein